MPKKSYTTNNYYLRKYSSSGGLLWANEIFAGLGIAVSSSEKLYYFLSNDIYEVDSSGGETLIHSASDAGAQLKIDLNDNLYFFDNGAEGVTKITSTGGVEWTTVQSAPFGLVFDVDDQSYLYAGSSVNGITKFDSSGSSIANWNGISAYPTALAVTPSSRGKLYVADTNTLKVVNTSDMSTSSGQFSPFPQNIVDIKPDPENNFVLAPSYDDIQKFTSTGGQIWRLTGKETYNEVAIDKDLNVYIPESVSSEKLLVYNSSGSLLWQSTAVENVGYVNTDDGYYGVGQWASSAVNVVIPTITSDAILQSIQPTIKIFEDTAIPAITTETTNQSHVPIINTFKDVIIGAITTNTTNTAIIPVLYKISNKVISAITPTAEKRTIIPNIITETYITDISPPNVSNKSIVPTMNVISPALVTTLDATNVQFMT